MLITQPPGFSTDWLGELRAGRAFSFGGDASAVAAQYSHVQLINPAASGVITIVRSVVISPYAAGGYQLASYNTALTTDSGAGINLDIGGSAGVSHVRSGNDASLLGTPFRTVVLAANAPFSFPYEWIAQLGEGEGILVRHTTVNIALSVHFEWIELPQ